jgi:hypothetical protein
VPSKTAPAKGPTVEEATAEATEARALVGALEARVAEGDDNIKPTDLREARDLADFAHTRVIAAQKRADEAERRNADDEAQAACDALRAAIASHNSTVTPAMVAAIDAFKEYVATVDEYFADLTAAATRVKHADRAAHACDVPTSKDRGVVVEGDLIHLFDEVGDRTQIDRYCRTVQVVEDVINPAQLDIPGQSHSRVVRHPKGRPSWWI